MITIVASSNCCERCVTSLAHSNTNSPVRQCVLVDVSTPGQVLWCTITVFDEDIPLLSLWIHQVHQVVAANIRLAISNGPTHQTLWTFTKALFLLITLAPCNSKPQEHLEPCWHINLSSNQSLRFISARSCIHFALISQLFPTILGCSFTLCEYVLPGK